MINVTTRLISSAEESAAATINPCKLCAPLGACLAFKGVANCIPLIHGSQGCATYIRRYTISHFREPIDIASSCFVESNTVFGGAENFNAGLDNLIAQYRPEIVGVCTNCLSETIGEDLKQMLHGYRENRRTRPLPALVPVSTPSYSGSHIDGFHAAVRALISNLVNPALPHHDRLINLLPGMVSPADLRYLREIVTDFDLELNLLPDYADTLDGGNWEEYHKLPEGGHSHIPHRHCRNGGRHHPVRSSTGRQYRHPAGRRRLAGGNLRHPLSYSRPTDRSCGNAMTFSPDWHKSAATPFQPNIRPNAAA